MEVNLSTTETHCTSPSTAAQQHSLYSRKGIGTVRHHGIAAADGFKRRLFSDGLTRRFSSSIWVHDNGTTGGARKQHHRGIMAMASQEVHLKDGLAAVDGFVRRRFSDGLTRRFSSSTWVHNDGITGGARQQYHRGFMAMASQGVH